MRRPPSPRYEIFGGVLVVKKYQSYPRKLTSNDMTLLLLRAMPGEDTDGKVK